MTSSPWDDSPVEPGFQRWLESGGRAVGNGAGARLGVTGNVPSGKFGVHSEGNGIISLGSLEGVS